MMEEDKSWFTKQVTMFNPEAFHLGSAYRLWYDDKNADGSSSRHYTGLLSYKDYKELCFCAICTDCIHDTAVACDTLDIHIEYDDIDKWDFELLTPCYDQLIMN